MDRSAKLTTEVMTRFLQSQLPELAEKIVAAVNSAPDGNWIAASEEPVRDAGHEFMRAAFEAALQQKVTAAEAAFPPLYRIQRERERGTKDSSRRPT